MSNNVASDADGGGIHNNDVLIVAQSIIASNTAVTGGNNCSLPSALTDHGYNLESGTDCTFVATTDLQSTNPHLDATGLQNNGGPTRTIALLAGSPALDRIPAADCLVTTDQRGVSRPQGPACDMGAFELITVTPTPEVTPTPPPSPIVTETPSPPVTPTVPPSPIVTATPTAIPTAAPEPWACDFFPSRRYGDIPYRCARV